MSQRPQQVRQSGICLIWEAWVGEWTPEPRTETCARGPLGLCAFSSSLTTYPPTLPTARRATNTHRPPQELVSRKMKHFGVSKLSKHLGGSTQPQSRERRGAGAAGPLKICSCSIWGSRSDEYFCSWPDRALQFLGGVARAGGAHPLPNPSPTEACPAQPARPGTLGFVCGFVLSIWRWQMKGRPPTSLSPPRGTADGKLRRGWGHPGRSYPL